MVIYECKSNGFVLRNGHATPSHTLGYSPCPSNILDKTSRNA